MDISSISMLFYNSFFSIFPFIIASFPITEFTECNSFPSIKEMRFKKHNVGGLLMFSSHCKRDCIENAQLLMTKKHNKTKNKMVE